jgi:hypothetical protein
VAREGYGDEAPVAEYGAHGDFLAWVERDAVERGATMEMATQVAFVGFTEQRATEWVVFERISVDDLARILRSHPVVLKPITALCNVAGRALTRDLGLQVDTYAPRLSEAEASAIAAYLQPFLPPALAVPVLHALDHVAFVDKEIRKRKGQWEAGITQQLSRRAGVPFKKRKFVVAGKQFELDAAMPLEGDAIDIGVDVKRIEAQRDIHKRVDEIANKARKFKTAYPQGRFGAVIYYPFEHEQVNILARLDGSDVDGVVFAGESSASVDRAVQLLLPQLGLDVDDLGLEEVLGEVSEPDE